MNKILEGRYWNTNGKSMLFLDELPEFRGDMTIVAVITEWKPGIGDWAAYIGADDGWEEEACIQNAADNGAKLSEADAGHFFPEIKLNYRN